MKPADYLNPEKFPLTSRPQYSLQDQVQIDGFNLYTMLEGKAAKRPMTEKALALMAELEEKAKYRDAMWKAIDEEDAAEKAQAK